MTVFPIPAFTDNYIWCIHDGHNAAVVDPGDAKPVQTYLAQQQLSLSAILITHHHADHIGGVRELLQNNQGLPVIGPDSQRIPQVNKAVAEGDEIQVPGLDVAFKVMAVPAHTLDHIAYLGEIGLFCGDTMFSAGCGRLFEGTPAQMRENFQRFKQLPGDTKVYCTHEYTIANLDFALAIAPDDGALQASMAEAKQKRAQNQPTLPTTIERETCINPYMRDQDPTIIAGVQQHWQEIYDSPLEVFTAIRRWKDVY